MCKDFESLLLNCEPACWEMNFEILAEIRIRKPCCLQTKVYKQNTDLGEVGSGGVGTKQLTLHGLLHTLDDTILMQKMYFMLRWMNVDIYVLWQYFKALK